MKIKLFKILFFVFIPIFAHGQIDKIEWNSRKLTWNDFMGSVDFGNNIEVAGVCYGWSKDVKNIGRNIKVSIICYVDPNESWAKKVSINSKYILNHEQRHFDLAEIYARKIRQEISSLKYTDPLSLLDSIDVIYSEYTSLGNKEQERYDLETSHSENKDKQEEWNKYIDNQLKELEVWKKTEILIHFYPSTKKDTIKK